jgi:flagellar basal-body rod protein FlgC
MSFLNSMDISSSALTAQRFRMDVISENIANADVTRTANGQPYKRRIVTMGEKQGTTSFSDQLNQSMESTSGGNGVVVSNVTDSNEPFKKVYDPSHPDADAKGYVNYPNVDTVTEMVDLISASRSYEANITAFNATKTMSLKALELGK